MFTGIVECTGKVEAIEHDKTNTVFWVSSIFGAELGVNQSVSHNGVCLTVTAIKGNMHSVTAVKETLDKTNLGELTIGSDVNLERAMATHYRFDGHLVQGHVDQTALVTRVEDVGGSWLYDFEYDPSVGHFLVEKGSICIDGVSLTVFNTQRGSFTVTIIPHTYQLTVFKHYKVGSRVNLEFDIIGKYIQKLFDAGYAEHYLKRTN